MDLRTTKMDYEEKPGEIEEIVDRFGKAMRKEMGDLIKSVVWFGSQAKRLKSGGKRSIRDHALFGSDIDVLIVFDDMVNVLTPEVITAYRVVTEKTASKISKRLHITTMPLTKFWDYSLKGDPILINMLRDGKAVFDTGCYGMAQKMLGSKRIHPSREIVWIYHGRGPMSISNANYNIRQAVMDLYWAVMDAAHAALLHHGVVPDTPDHVVPLMKHHLVSKGIMHKRNLSLVGEFMNVGKMIMRGELSRVSGDNYDRYRKEAHDFVHVVKEIISTR